MNQKVQFLLHSPGQWERGSTQKHGPSPTPSIIHNWDFESWVHYLRMKWSPAHLPLYPGYLDHSGPAGNFVLFPMATDSFPVVTYYQTRGGLQQRKFILSPFWRTESEFYTTGQKSRCLQRCAPSRNSRKESLLLPPAPSSSYCQQSLAVCRISVLFQASTFRSLSFFSTPFSALLPHTSPLCTQQISLCLSLIKTPVLGLEPTQITQANLLTSKNSYQIFKVFAR